MICGFAAFKNHVLVTFFNGAIMSDKHQLFSDGCSGKKLRTIKFKKSSEIANNKLVDYFKEAFLLGEIKIENDANKKEIEIPTLLQKALGKNTLAKENFENMPYTYRKEYANHIADAKREATKLSRLEKVIHNLEKNFKMHEQYKC
jgi:uncharacterized protein YdeI (YjbR/CyaY-like superfamily)